MGHSSISKQLLNSSNLLRSILKTYDFQQGLDAELTKNEFHHPRHRRSANVSWSEVMDGELLQNTTISEFENKEIRIWDRGILEKAETKYILNIFQIVSIAFGLLSVGAVTLSVIVFWDKRMTSRLVILITAFNVTEGGKILAYVIHRTWRLAQENSVITWASAYAIFFANFITWFPDSVGRISLLINLVITLDRFVILAFPLKSINRKIVVYPKITVAILALSMFAFQMSNLILFRMKVAPNVNYTRKFMMNEIVAEMAFVSPYAVSIYRIMHVVASICFRYIPLIVTITLNIMTIVSLVYHHKLPSDRQMEDGSRKSNIQDVMPSKIQARKRQNNVMIVGSTLIYSLLVSGKPLIRVVSMLHPTFGEGKKDNNLYSVMNELGLLLDMLSPMITFFSYCKLSSAFRHVLYCLFMEPKSKVKP